MKISLAFIALFLSPVVSFAPAFSRHASCATQRQMFGGTGGAEPLDEEQEAQVKQAAEAMGMSVEEYQLGMEARMKLDSDLSGMKLTAGSDDIKVVRDGNNPPKFLDIIVTEEGKAKGKETVGKEIVAALKAAGEDAKEGRAQAQKDMMAFIGEKLKK